MSEPYLYKIINTVRRRPLHLRAHCNDLSNYSSFVFDNYIEIDVQQIEQRIVSMLIDQTPLTDLSIFVEMRLYASHRIDISIGEMSIYSGYALRAIHPLVNVVQYDVLMDDYPTTAARALAAMANWKVRKSGANIAIRLGADNQLHTADGSPLFGIRGNKIYTSPKLIDSLERSLTMSAARSLGMEVVIMPLAESHLMLLDELLYANHYGITAIAGYNERLYADILAGKIAAEMNRD